MPGTLIPVGSRWLELSTNRVVEILAECVYDTGPAWGVVGEDGQIRGGTLPDGTALGFHHRHGAGAATWALLSEAVWWSDAACPEWLGPLGAEVPTGELRREMLADLAAAREERP